MPDAEAFPQQSPYAFATPTADQPGEDDPDAAAARNREIQAAFDAQRFQRGLIQSLAAGIARKQSKGS